MSYVFRLHDTGNIQIKGWERSAKLSRSDIQTIPDTIKKGRTSKIGSSIPTPLARLYLFETAFQMVSDEPYGDTMYHHLVSDCLDLFQFIFMNAGGEHLMFKKWNIEKQIQGLKSSSFVEHQQLGYSLDLAINSKKLKGTKEIYLIYYKNKLVGGTSPITGVYTSPNWKNIVQQEGWVFDTPIGDILFDDAPYTIYQRDEDFQLYMFRFVYAYNDILAQRSSAFYAYFDNCRIHVPEVNKLCLENKISPDYTPQNLLSDYDYINVSQDEGNIENLYSGNCAIVKQKEDDIPLMIQRVSDFLMEPSRTYFKNKVGEDGSLLTNYTPLVLINGNHRLNYIDSEWDPNIKVVDIPTMPLHRRKLPRFNTYKYPYVTIGDFLEEVLIELPFNIDNKRFFTGYSGNFKYLLPIKKEYFNFFSMEDLKQQLTISKEGEVFKVSLKIPIKHGNSIMLSRSFDTSDSSKVAASKGSRGLNLGFFPFYKVVDKTQLNRYSILLASNINDLRLDFYEYPNIVNEQKVIPQDVTARTKQTKVDVGSVYYDIRERTFDIIEINQGQILKGLIIPMMKEIEVENNIRKFHFAIDFGTSNTHIAYDTDDQSDAIQGFDIQPEDRQMILLSELNTQVPDLEKQISSGLGEFIGLDMINREFVPSFICPESSTNFPIRTAICENMAFRNDKSKLFGNINIGFALERDVSLSDEQYHTNIKWMLDNVKNDHRPKVRIEAFFEEILWLIKNKILLNGGRMSPAPEIITMVPLSMRLKSRGDFKFLWQEAADRVFGKNIITIEKAKFESVMPYYSVIKDRSRNVVNIDIGGGTTDIFFFYKDPQRYFSTSFRFAGNDIWGEGTLNESEKLKDNGFFMLLDEKYEQDQIRLTDENLGTIYKFFKGRRTLGSADITSFLFKYDEEFQFSTYIRNHAPLVSILFIHLAGIIYQVVQILKRQGVPNPEEVSFTGKGSEYLKLISRDEDNLTLIIKKMLEVFSKEDNGDVKEEKKYKASNFFKVTLTDHPKELTAEGAIKEKNANEREKIKEGDTENIISMGYSKYTEDGVTYDPLKPITVEDIPKVKTPLLKSFNDFIEKMKDPALKMMLKEFNVKYKYEGFDILEFLKEYGTERSYRAVAHNLTINSDEDEVLKENPFFWFFKDTLYELSKELYKKA